MQSEDWRQAARAARISLQEDGIFRDPRDRNCLWCEAVGLALGEMEEDGVMFE